MGDWGTFVAFLTFVAGLYVGPRYAAYIRKCEEASATPERDLKGVRWATRGDLGAPSRN